MRLAALSIDLDEVPCYAAIHGLAAPDEATAQAIYRKAVPRFAELFGERGLPATFFAVGRDLDAEHARSVVAGLAANGFEIGNHSFHHRYELTRLPREQMREDIARGADAIERATGTRPTGFRAPGYTVNDALYEALEELGVAYDSSVFPCPAYHGAKAIAIAAIAARGRRSQSIVNRPGVLTAPADPYRVGHPYFRRGTGLLELPIGVTREVSGRLPFIGTFLSMAGPAGSAFLTRRIVGRPLVNLELHGIDLSDCEEDELTFLRAHQADLRAPLRRKRAALERAIDELTENGYEFVTLAEAARRFAAS